MITQQSHKKPIPVKSSLALLGSILLSTAIIMACTDMQTQHVFDEEELNIMTDMDRTGDRGHHQIIIYMGDEEQAERYSDALDQLRTLEPEHIQSVDVLRGEDAIEQYGDRASNGVIVVRTKLEWESYSTTLETLGLNPQSPPAPPSPPEPGTESEDYVTVAEQMPELIGGLSAVMQEIKYPEEAREAGMEGRVFVQFIVDENGDVVDPQIIRSAGDPLDEEALRVVEQAKFKPGMQRGQPVKVQYSLPIFFRLQGSESTQEQSENIPAGESTDEMTVIGYNDE